MVSPLKKKRAKRNLYSGAKTIVDIADKTGLSLATVSRALNNFHSMKLETKEKVLAAAEELNYQPNFAARSLVGGRSNLVGLVLPNTNAIYNDIPRYFTEFFKEKSYRTLTYRSYDDKEKQQFNIEAMLKQRVDAIAICPVLQGHDFVEQLKATSTPFAVFNSFINKSNVSNVNFDFRKGMNEMIDSLVESGCSKFYYFKQELYSRGQRRDTFSHCMKIHGFEAQKKNVISVSEALEDTYGHTMKLLKSDNRPDAIICSSDYTAIAAIRAILDTGDLKIPEDISVVGCYKTDLSRYTEPKISSISADFEAMMNKVCSVLLKKVANSNFINRNYSIPTTYVPSSSSR